MEYLSAADILAVHDRVIEETGGALGVREANLLASIAERPKPSFGGAEQFPDIFTKAAVYIESIATYHIFIDGNKRTALTVAGVFLALNGYHATFPVAETEKIMLAAAQRQRSLEEITAWLKKRSKKVKKK
ncbi:MAG TPA: type II toxin-antitoxin system death-on-curing family toxin [Candidatus Paceibacterota bacterium]|jgi:death-on-curing protein|nr:type II toxin-antitoxin system death-on-curing family toxin [Candidatus Paceibacterota bacterium]